MIPLPLLLAAAVQDAPPVETGADGTTRWSVLAERCAAPVGNEVVVCAPTDTTAARLPLPDERVRPAVPRAPTGDPRAALDAAGTPCAAVQRGCATMFGPSLGQVIGLAKAAAKALKGRPEVDRSKRVPIPLD